uniref:Uncharacterized protein n=1 Tax=Anguilla anguilla TaxID=7936 RepID=A0A0E9Q3A7_ANGAN
MYGQHQPMAGKYTVPAMFEFTLLKQKRHSGSIQHFI